MVIYLGLVLYLEFDNIYLNVIKYYFLIIDNISEIFDQL